MSTNDMQRVVEFSTTFNDAVDSIPAYDDFLSSWQKFVVENDNRPLDRYHEHIEQFAVTALSRLLNDSTGTSEGFATSPLFNSIHNSAVICHANGGIAASNKQAIQNYGLMQGMQLGSTGLKLGDGADVISKIRRLLKSESSENRLELLQCYFHREETMIPLVMMQISHTGKVSTQNHVLVIFIDAACNSETLSLFSNKFGLTEAETTIVAAFSQGIPLREIAKTRHRSYITIRNQFQSVLEKTGCPNQADVLRTLLGLSYLLSYTKMVSTGVPSELGKRIEVMRPRGRFVDVRLYGKPDGKPFLVLPSLFGMPVTPKIESLLMSRSLLMVGVWRPGFSGTSRPEKNDDLYHCLANDVTTILDNMGIEHCPLMGRASAALSVVNLMRLIPERISRALIVNSLIPLPYVARYNVTSRWTAALVSANERSPMLTSLILATGRKLMMRSGVKQFLTKMYHSSAMDQEVIHDPEIIASVYQGVEQGTLQGLSGGATQDIIDGFRDWSDDVSKLGGKISLLQGTHDPHISINASKQFVDDFPNTLELIEFLDGGGLLNFTHPDAIMNHIFPKP